MIAFYFGNKALEYLMPIDKKKADTPEETVQTPLPGDSGDKAAGLNPVAPVIPATPANATPDEPAKG